MTISDRDKRAIKILLFTVVPGLIWLVWPTSDSSVKPAAQAVSNSREGLEVQLQRLRAKEAKIPEKEGLLKDVQSQLIAREKGLIVADTLPQAQAMLVQSVRQVARQEGFDLRNVTIAQPAIYGGEYGQIAVQVTAECGIDQVTNFLADITKRPELIATEDMRINLGNPKNKTLQFAVTVSGLVPKRLVPEKRPGVL
ncbi:MAG TPA: type II secretion system protein GspM [Bryobacteraceae bacterium]|jgi:Tfp pilus assembly protein PilO